MRTAPISVVIPTFNSDSYLREAIESVEAQTLGLSEIIVVDNNSSDESVEIARTLNTRVVFEPREGLSKARNAGVRAASQEWIAFLDADDIWEQDKMARQWEAIKSCPAVRIVFTDYSLMRNDSVINNQSREDREKRWADLDSRVLVGNDTSYFSEPIPDFFIRFSELPSTAMIHRDVFTSIGAFDETMTHLDDLELFLRAIAKFPVAIVESALVRYRQHERNMSRNVIAKRSAFFSLVNHMLSKPQSYPPGVGQAYIEQITRRFLEARLQRQKATPASPR